MHLSCTSQWSGWSTSHKGSCWIAFFCIHYCRASPHTWHCKSTSNVLVSCHSTKITKLMEPQGGLSIPVSGENLVPLVPALPKQHIKDLLTADGNCRVHCGCSPGFKGRNSLARYFALALCAYSVLKISFSIQFGRELSWAAQRPPLWPVRVPQSQQGTANAPCLLLLPISQQPPQIPIL